MLGPRGNPTSKSLFTMIEALQKVKGLRLRVHEVEATRKIQCRKLYALD